jgi:hypothetical protein
MGKDLGVIGGLALTKFLFLVLIAAAVLAPMGFVARTAWGRIVRAKEVVSWV